jgi:hypothetical protein
VQQHCGTLQFHNDRQFQHHGISIARRLRSWWRGPG